MEYNKFEELAISLAEQVHEIHLNNRYTPCPGELDKGEEQLKALRLSADAVDNFIRENEHLFLKNGALDEMSLISVIGRAGRISSDSVSEVLGYVETTIDRPSAMVIITQYAKSVSVNVGINTQK
ncbi:MAG TPA: hypothetical protein DIV86_04795 [Alphaproteobacteria bacterium]|nr:hypothetical protein [Alphaproteobacteria bacterium]